MLEGFINNRIMVKDSVNSWEEAIKIAAEPMLKDGLIEERYIDSMIKNVIENGTYIIILPGLAIPPHKTRTWSYKNRSISPKN